MQMHHTAIELRQMMPQADFRTALGLMMTDMEALAKEGGRVIVFENGTHGVDDLREWSGVDSDTTTRAGRITKELVRLGYAVRYNYVRPDRGPVVHQMVVSW